MLSETTGPGDCHDRRPPAPLVTGTTGFRFAVVVVTGNRRAERLRELTQPFESVPAGQFEVVDVRLTVGVMDGGGNGWLAYGTLAK